MLGRRCPTCRRALDPDQPTCPYCGAAVGRPPRAALAGTWSITSEGTGPHATFETAGGVSGRIEPSVESAPSDRRALRAIAFGAAMAFVAGLIGIVTAAGLPVASVLLGGSGGDTVSVSLLALTGLALAGAAAFSVVQAFLFRSAFEGLAFFDPRFARPSTLALLAVFGILVTALGAVLIVGSFYEATVCAGSASSIPPSCVPGGPLLVGLFVAAIGTILAFVGYVGVALGIWRTGGRYRSTMLRVGAVLMVVPFVATVGAVVVWVGARRRSAHLG